MLLSCVTLPSMVIVKDWINDTPALATRQPRRPHESFEDDDAIKALVAYRALTGDLEVPSKYVIPTTGAESVLFPPWLQGMPLGRLVGKIPTSTLVAPEMLADLDLIGFLWRGAGISVPCAMADQEDDSDRKRIKNVPLAALVSSRGLYRLANGDDPIDSDFVVPDDLASPVVAKGILLAHALSQLETCMYEMAEFLATD